MKRGDDRRLSSAARRLRASCSWGVKNQHRRMRRLARKGPGRGTLKPSMGALQMFPTFEAPAQAPFGRGDALRLFCRGGLRSKQAVESLRFGAVGENVLFEARRGHVQMLGE